ncbi:hypothetical protein [Hungatella effluvii]|uniref:hypothetical protein n=1 Tax=Hungatella effluvii TaxID=1096246 RepID=UPI0022E3ED57|nr:hypothetical protein [Hungatella effluvii]
MKNLIKKMVTMALVIMITLSVPFSAHAENYTDTYAPTDFWAGSYYSTDGEYVYMMDVAPYWNDPNWRITIYKYPANDPYAQVAASWTSTIWIEPQYKMTDENEDGWYSTVARYSGDPEHPMDAFFMYAMDIETAKLGIYVLGPIGSAFPVGDAYLMQKISDSYTLQFRGDIPSWYWNWCDTYQSAFVNYKIWSTAPMDTMPSEAATDPWAFLYSSDLPAAS